MTRPRSLHNLLLLPLLRPHRKMSHSCSWLSGFPASTGAAAASSFANGGGNSSSSSDDNSANAEAIRKSKRWLEELTADKIPRREFEVSYARSSGPGGQNVNKGKLSSSL